MKHPRRKLDPAVAFWVARCLVAISCVSFVLCSIAAWKTRFWTSVCWCPENECHSPVLFSLNFYSVPPRCCNLVFEVHSSRMVFPFVNGNGVYPRFKKKYPYVNMWMQPYIHYKKFLNRWQNNFITDHRKTITKRHLWCFFIPSCIKHHLLTLVMFSQKHHKSTQSMMFLNHHRLALSPRNPT